MLVLCSSCMNYLYALVVCTSSMYSLVVESTSCVYLLYVLVVCINTCYI